jgi:hypothetical protein
VPEAGLVYPLLEASGSSRVEKLGGNADACENKGVGKRATQKMLKTKE